MDPMNGYGERGGRGVVNLGRLGYAPSSSSGSVNGTSVATLLPSLTSHFQAAFGHSAPPVTQEAMYNNPVGLELGDYTQALSHNLHLADSNMHLNRPHNLSRTHNVPRAHEHGRSHDQHLPPHFPHSMDEFEAFAKSMMHHRAQSSLVPGMPESAPMHQLAHPSSSGTGTPTPSSLEHSKYSEMRAGYMCHNQQQMASPSSGYTPVITSHASPTNSSSNSMQQPAASPPPRNSEHFKHKEPPLPHSTEDLPYTKPGQRENASPPPSDHNTSGGGDDDSGNEQQNEDEDDDDDDEVQMLNSHYQREVTIVSNSTLNIPNSAKLNNASEVVVFADEKGIILNSPSNQMAPVLLSAKGIKTVKISKSADNRTVVKILFLETDDKQDEGSGKQVKREAVQYIEEGEISVQLGSIKTEVNTEGGSAEAADQTGTSTENSHATNNEATPEPTRVLPLRQRRQRRSYSEMLEADFEEIDETGATEGENMNTSGGSSPRTHDGAKVSHMLAMQMMLNERAELNIHIDDSHVEYVDGQKRWKCHKCEKSYSTKHNLMNHMLGHSGIKPHCCLVCGKFFKQQSHLQTHMLRHGNIRPHICKICNRAFTQQSHMKRHMTTHMERRPYSCEKCNRGFAYPSELKAHLEKHARANDNTCTDCGECFENAKKLLHHQQTQHRTNMAELTCKECGKVFSYPSQLRDHLIKHSGERPFMCSECGMEFMKEHHLRAHQFTHSGLKPWACHICGRGFNQKANMQRHLVVHEDTKRYKCDTCGKDFAQPQTLKAHQVTHAEKKPYQCPMCGKEFGRLHNLQGHMHIHKDSRPHNCFCGASFTLKGNLNRHRKVKHGLDDSIECTDEEAAQILNSMSTSRLQLEETYSYENEDLHGLSYTESEEDYPPAKKARKSIPRKTMPPESDSREEEGEDDKDDEEPSNNQSGRMNQSYDEDDDGGTTDEYEEEDGNTIKPGEQSFEDNEEQHQQGNASRSQSKAYGDSAKTDNMAVTLVRDLMYK